MKEVEIKARLKDVEAAKQALRALGCELSAPIIQDDTTYVRNPGPVATYLNNPEFLRLRVEGDGRVLFTLKYHPGRADDLSGAPEEHETVVGSREIMERMLSRIGFKEAVRTKKSRIKTRHNNWEICIDEVDELGSFIEIEELAEEGVQIPRIHEAMRSFLAAIGVPVEEGGLQRYDILMLEKAAGAK